MVSVRGQEAGQVTEDGALEIKKAHSPWFSTPPVHPRGWTKFELFED